MEFIELHTAPGEHPNFARLIEIAKTRGLVGRRQSPNEYEATLRNTWRRMIRWRKRGIR